MTTHVRCRLPFVLDLNALWAIASVALGCDGGAQPPPTDGGRDARPDSGPQRACVDDAACDNGIFCDGAERCEPFGAGCIPGSPPCLGTQVCNETARLCRSQCELTGDADSDGQVAVECGGGDCDDSDAERFPGNLEICDLEGHDEDCDPESYGQRDLDLDGFEDGRCCNGEGAALRCGEDCDDARRTVHPTATEACDHIDNDCDGEIDEQVSISGFADADADGHGDPEAPATGCAGDASFVETAGDCNDLDPEVSPSVGEACDGVDNDCDPATRDAFDATAQPWYRDADGDGYGERLSAPVVSCARPGGPLDYSLASGDCDDFDATRSPASPERCNGIDDNCDGRANYVVTRSHTPGAPPPGPGDFEDDDGDGAADAECGGPDCDDRDWRTAPGAPEIADARDNDCDGMIDEAADPTRWYAADDADGFGDDLVSQISAQPIAGHVQRAGNCVPDEAAIHPGATEICDGVDQDCDGRADEGLLVMLFPDVDGDGYGDARRPAVSGCSGVPGLVNDASDCDDSQASVRPDAPDVCDDLTDSDCDGRIDDRECARGGVLSFIHTSDGALEPRFDPEITDYVLHLPFTVPDLRLTPHCAGSVAGYCAQVQGAPLAHDQASAWLAAVDGTVYGIDGPDGTRYNVTLERPVCQLQYLRPPAPEAGMSFGSGLASSGHELVVGARFQNGPAGVTRAGAVHVFARERAGTPFRHVQQLVPAARDSDDFLGTTVALCGQDLFASATGDDAALGMPLTDNSGMDLGAVHHFRRTARQWRWHGALRPTIAGGRELGRGLVCDEASGLLVIAQIPHVGVYDLADPTAPLASWSGSGSALFGWSAAVSGSRVVIGEIWTGNNMGNAVVFERNPGAATYSEVQRTASFGVGPWDNYGTSTALDGRRLVVGSKDESATAGVFGPSSPGAGTPQAACTGWPEKDYGAVYVYERGAIRFDLTHYLKSPSPYCADRFGEAVTVRGDLILVGARSEDTVGTGASHTPRANGTGPVDSGGVYLYARRHGTWLLVAHIKADVADAQDSAGGAVLLGERFLAFSALGDDSGDPADPLDNSAADAGAVWVCSW